MKQFSNPIVCMIHAIESMHANYQISKGLSCVDEIENLTTLISMIWETHPKRTVTHSQFTRIIYTYECMEICAQSMSESM